MGEEESTRGSLRHDSGKYVAPIIVEPVTNVLAGTSKEGILKAYGAALEKAKHAAVPPLWDGKAAERIWEVIAPRTS